MRRTLIFSLIVCASSIWGCSNKGYVIIEKSEAFNTEKRNVKTSDIYYFEPTVTSYYIRKAVENQFLAAEKYKEITNEALKKTGRRSGFKVKMLTSETIQNDYSQDSEELLQLRRSILNATALQDNPINSGRRVSDRYKQRKIFVTPPRFASEFSHLSGNYSPYFGLTGIFAVDAEPSSREARDFMSRHKSIRYGKYYYFYHMVVNIETSEIIYREVKQVPYKFSPKYLSVILTDSYALLKENLQ